MSTAEILQRMRDREASLCFRLNLCRRRPAFGRFMAAVSRLGDGVFWYTLLLGLLLFGPKDSSLAVLRMATTGLVITVFYKALKLSTGRPRPCDAHPEIDVLIAPLDRWSFPSGHTMHAVCFTILAASHLPPLAWFLVPFTSLVMLSRIVLGLRYPTDVLAGAAIGGSAALLAAAIG